MGYTGPVKSQGGCGSCYAFAATTALEGRIAYESGKPYQRLSEQQAVDCANWDATQDYKSYGCSGGFPGEVWRYFSEQGAMPEADYKYTSGSTGNVESCKFDRNKVVAKGATYGSVDKNAAAIRNAL